MTHARTLRLDRGWTFAELALVTGISARALAEFEYGLQSLDRESLMRLAQALGVTPSLIMPVRAGVARLSRRTPLDVGGLAVAGLLSAMLASAAPNGTRPELGAAWLPGLPLPGENVGLLPADTPPSAPTPTDAPTATPAEAPTATPTATPSPTATPIYALLPDGPHGCPVQSAVGQIVITQGYGVGTHTPAHTWGAVDLAIDGDGDGYAEPGATAGATVVATLGGVARVFPNSWPGGNFIIITDAGSGWATAYGHLASMAVADGQTVAAGQLIGTVGSTGMSSGPHLHYEVRSPAGNIDPAPLLGCQK
ncbi:MAG TPA: peptidoglycan DD-metalloendopeptidase family protein [Roseiflexaceae bacterium]|nr:peptidoglycan DD-metalloendopeptidase family protein [Roseiflexaceae bacterium]